MPVALIVVCPHRCRAAGYIRTLANHIHTHVHCYFDDILTHWHSLKPPAHSFYISLGLCLQNKALFVATLSGSVSELCHISGVSPTRPHQVPVTVLPGCPWEPRDTKAPFVPHHPGIRAIFIKVEGARHGHRNNTWRNTIALVYSCTKASKTKKIFTSLISFYYLANSFYVIYNSYALILLNKWQQWAVKVISPQTCYSKMSRSGSVEWKYTDFTWTRRHIQSDQGCRSDLKSERGTLKTLLTWIMNINEVMFAQ